MIAIDAAAFVSSLGAIDFLISDETAVHMENTAPLPIVGGSAQPPVIGSVAAPTTSMWQSACTAIRSLLDCDWALRRTGAVAVVNSVSW